ncbi:uncharacterized protein TRUGW13939_04585 [Talaromyces rugulosus]|uniref:Large ribosomal subunit protein mL54 n=1 Tax=Talaromyces rugulosus TaxID=121627 RepID=A0A7H8QVD7_TALRU|nr:uncharacterized protein TRUGW13939_04585 [Talaromyces rugulosus]QKX57471.1 hypothetical protein TRUGW13939_04585 [Talaromyces rugulosus]
MICQRCRTHLLSRIQFQQHVVRSPSTCGPSLLAKSQTRFSSTDTPKTPATPPPPTPTKPGIGAVNVSAAVSSATPGVSQPLSTPTDGVPQPPAWVNPGKGPAAAAAAASSREPSSCAAGTVMSGLNYIKNKPDIVALEDHEYPEWLWKLLDNKSNNNKKDGGVDVSSLNKKLRKKHDKKMAALAASRPRKIPVHEQAVDITPANYNSSQDGPRDVVAEAADSLAKRETITKSAREARRKGIRESNFLRGL